VDQWDPADVEAHMAFLHHVSALLKEKGEFVDAQALTPAQTWVRFDGEGTARSPQTARTRRRRT
jgi:hypothetical protein